MKRILSNWRPLAIACALSALGACSILPETPSRDNYRLPPTTLIAPQHSGASIGHSLQVSTPHGGRMLEGLRMLVIRQDNQLNVYKGAQWIDPAPVMLRDRLLDGFYADGRIKSVIREAEGLSPDLELRSDLRQFQVEYRENRPVVVIQLDAALISPSARRTVASRRFSIAQPAAGEQVPEIVQTFGMATDQLTQEVVQWSVGQAAGPRR